MKVLFSVPIMSYISDAPPIIQDLGLGYLVTAVRKDGHEALIKDWNMPPSVEDYVEYLKKEKPQVVGLKVFTKDVGAAAKTIHIIKSVDPSIIVIVGGPHPSTVSPEELFEDLVGADFAFRGEAEVALPIFLKYQSSPPEVNSRKILRDVPGLVWRQDGSVIANDVKFVDVNQFELPSWDLLKPSDYPALMGLNNLHSGNPAPFITSRGCPGRCSFCSVKMINGQKVRRRSLKSVMDELSFLYHEQNVRFLMIMDNGFLVDEDYVQDMCESIIDKGLKFKWDCVFIDTGKALKQKTMRLMKKAGCVMVNLGVETASDRMRRLTRKNNKIGTVREIVSLLKKNDIDVFGFFMMGFPTETRIEIQESIRLARALDFKMVSFTICYPIPGTEVYKYVLQTYNIRKIDWTSFKIHSSPYPLSELTSQNLSRLSRRTNLEFAIRKNPKYLYKKSIELIKKRFFVKR